MPHQRIEELVRRDCEQFPPRGQEILVTIELPEFGLQWQASSDGDGFRRSHESPDTA